jgi:hypothetical protein
VNHYRYLQSTGIALYVDFGQVQARDVVSDQAVVGIRVGNGSLDLADSDISSNEAAIDAGDLNTNSGTRAVTIANTTLHSTRVAIAAAGAQLTVTDCTLARGPGLPDRLARGMELLGGTLTLTRSVIRGFELEGIDLERAFELGGSAAVPSAALDQVQIDAGEGISVGAGSAEGEFRMRKSRVTGQHSGLALDGFATIDLGTVDSPGGNQISNASGGPAVEDWSDDGGAIDAHGTTLNGTSFNGQVQGPASVAGGYLLHGSDVIRF